MTENLHFTTRHRFIHRFANDRVLVMSVDTTAKEIRFHFDYHPMLKNRKELEEIATEWGQWREFLLGGKFGPHHGIRDFLFQKSCEIEVENLINHLPP